MVVARFLDGGDDVLHGYAKPGDRPGPPEWCFGQLVLVGFSADRHANRVRLRPPVASFQRVDGR